MTQQPASKPKPRISRDIMVASICGFVVAFMVGASYAAVPFYDWFLSRHRIQRHHAGRDLIA